MIARNIYGLLRIPTVDAAVDQCVALPGSSVGHKQRARDYSSLLLLSGAQDTWTISIPELYSEPAICKLGICPYDTVVVPTYVQALHCQMSREQFCKLPVHCRVKAGKRLACYISWC